ncbi:MAG: hypothetical protein R6X21_04410 [Candidatus Aminicenantes bacterium]
MKIKRTKATPLWTESPLVDEREIFSDLAVKKGSSLFLGRYSMKEVLAVLDKRSFFKEARKRFLWPLAFELDSSEYPLQRLQIFLREAKPENTIVDIKLKETEFVPKGALEGLPSLSPQKALAFEWLTLQNPVQKFSEHFTPLPGQARPGLSLGPKVLHLFMYLGRVAHKDCLLAYPAYFHNALLFSRYFRFWNPGKEGEVLAIRSLFSHSPLKQLAWVVHLNCLKTEDGTPYEWTAEEQVLPLSRALKGYFDSRGYREAVKTARKNQVFTVDWAEFERKSKGIPALCGGL